MEIYLVLYGVYLGSFPPFIKKEMALLFESIFKEAVPAHDKSFRRRRDALSPLALAPRSSSFPEWVPSRAALRPFLGFPLWLLPWVQYSLLKAHSSHKALRLSETGFHPVLNKVKSNEIQLFEH